MVPSGTSSMQSLAVKPNVASYGNWKFYCISLQSNPNLIPLTTGVELLKFVACSKRK